jgi:hypothetical protein
MTRRTLGLLTAVLIWGVSATAVAQTTTSSSTTSSTSTSTTSTSTSTTSASTTSTTRVNPCTGQPCTADPPEATLSGSGGSARLFPEGCWQEIVGELTKCVISARALDPPVGLVVRTGETLTLRFDTTLLPREVILHQENQPGAGTVLTPANPTTFVADLPVGVYFISFTTKWAQGDVGYSLEIDVRAATPAQDPRPLALTG